MSRRLAVLAVPVAFLALLASACGGSSGSSSDDTTSTEEWAGSLCTAIVDWTDAMRPSTDALTSGDLSKDALKSAANNAKSATTTLIDDVKGLGKPDTEVGAEAQNTIGSLADDLQKDVDDLDGAVNGTGKTVATVATVSTTVVTMENQLSETFTQLQQLDAKGELEDAFKSADSCKQFTS